MAPCEVQRNCHKLKIIIPISLVLPIMTKKFKFERNRDEKFELGEKTHVFKNLFFFQTFFPQKLDSCAEQQKNRFGFIC